MSFASDKEALDALRGKHADSSAAIFVNGELLVATEEERFRRVKHWAGFPSEAIKFCLKEAECTLDDVTPRYHALISAFHSKTGVPILLNTSFNENEPIVNASEHAYACYARTSMDMLVLENCVIRRESPSE